MRRSIKNLARASVIALVLGGSTLTSSATAKVTCAEPLDVKARALAGLPAAPEPGVTYSTSIVTATRHPVNPEPVLMLARCEGREDRQFVQLTPREPGGGEVRSTFSVEFKRAGRWIVVLMDRSGTFFNIGTYDVAAPSQSATGTAESTSGVPTGLVIALGLGALGGAAALRGRRYWGA